MRNTHYLHAKCQLLLNTFAIFEGVFQQVIVKMAYTMSEKLYWSTRMCWRTSVVNQRGITARLGFIKRLCIWIYACVSSINLHSVAVSLVALVHTVAVNRRSTGLFKAFDTCNSQGQDCSACVKRICNWITMGNFTVLGSQVKYPRSRCSNPTFRSWSSSIRCHRGCTASSHASNTVAKFARSAYAE